VSIYYTLARFKNACGFDEIALVNLGEVCETK